MAIKVRIGDEERDLAAASESWIAEQLHRRRQDGQNVCLQVSINVGSLNMRLATPGCTVKGGSRRPNEQEQGIFDLWAKRGLDQPDFPVGGVIAFLQQLARVT
jgi:hypothetical protein